MWWGWRCKRYEEDQRKHWLKACPQTLKVAWNIHVCITSFTDWSTWELTKDFARRFQSYWERLDRRSQIENSAEGRHVCASWGALGCFDLPLSDSPRHQQLSHSRTRRKNLYAAQESEQAFCCKESNKVFVRKNKRVPKTYTHQLRLQFTRNDSIWDWIT